MLNLELLHEMIEFVRPLIGRLLYSSVRLNANPIAFAT